MHTSDSAAEAIYRKGVARQRIGKWADAARAFAEAAAMEPDRAAAHFRLGQVCQHLERWAEAATTLEQAVRLDRGASHGFYRLDWRHRLAFAYRALGEFDRATECYRAAAALDPSLTDWLSQLDALVIGPELAALWRLVDLPPEVADEGAAHAMIERARPIAHRLPDKWWFAAYCEQYKRGWVRSAYAAKQVAASVARRSAHEPFQHDTERRLECAAAFADAGDYAAARRYAEAALQETGTRAPGAAIDLAAGLALLDGDLRAARAHWTGLSPDERDASYLDLVQGRSIAIVAPGATGAPHGAEIDGFDLVVRTNFRAHDIIEQHASLIGRRTDICYFNGNFEPQHRAAITESLQRNPIRFVVLRFEDPAADCYRDVVPVRVSRTLNAFYRMNTYAVPKIIFDVLRFQPSRVKVFNADFFLSQQSHYSSYLDYEVDLIPSFFGHDVLRNIRMARILYRRGLFEADPVLAEILELEEEATLGRIAAKANGVMAARRQGKG